NALIKRSYYYKNFDDNTHPEISSGIFFGKQPFPWAFITSYEFTDVIHTDIKTYLNIPDSSATSSGKSVLYEKVKEVYECTRDCENSPNHKKEYIFSLPISENKPIVESYQDVPNLPLPHMDFLSGLLLEERMINNQNQIVYKIKNTYNNDNPDLYFNQFSYNSISDFALSSSLSVANIGLRIIPQGGVNLEIYEFKKNYSYIYSAWIKLLETTKEDYKDGIPTMITTTEYEYDNTYSHLNPVLVKTTNSLGQETKTEYKYNHPYKKDEPTEVITYENGTPVSIQKTTFNSVGLPQYVFAKKGASSLDSTLPSEDLKITYDKYDENGNLQQYTLADGTPVSIVWGYNGQYPIAKVEGVAYTTIASQAGTLAGLSDTGSLIETSFETLRNTSGALVTCYIYEPLVGVTTIIQPNGQKEVYEYDNAGRLQQVKDQDGKILKKIDYNYQH